MKISIVTPSYNQAEYLRLNIESVLAQNYHDFEHIVMDGGSTDNSVNVLKSYSHLIWKSEKDKGQSDAINKALDVATGEIIGWLNSDDVYFEGAFENVIQIFEKYPEVDVVYGNGVQIDKNGRIVHRRKNTKFHYKTWFYGMADPYQPEVFFRKSVIDHVGALDINFHMMMDRELWIRMAFNGHKFHYINTELAALRVYPDTKTAKFADLNDQERFKLHDLYWKGFRFSSKKLHRFHWRILNIYYLVLRKIKIQIFRM